MILRVTIFFILCLMPLHARAQSSDSTSYSLDPQFRVGVRGYEPHGLAIVENQTDGLANFEITDQLKLQVGARILSNAAYVNDRDHYGTLGGYEGAESELREANLEYRNGPILIRVGSQVVVWGEAFGTYYADIINPKDLRTAGFGDINEFRKPIEMINLQYIRPEWSLQFLFIPFYRPNRMPRPFSDFFPTSFAEAITQSGVSLANVDFDQSPDPESKAADFALRYQGRLGAFDYSVFTFFHTDRNPVFRFGFKSPTELYVRTSSRATNATGLTFSWAGDAVVVRGEVVHYSKRSFNFLTKNVLDPIGIMTSDQDVIVLGADLPLNQFAAFEGATGWQIGTQISYDRIAELNQLGRSQSESLIGFQLSRDADRATAFRIFGGLSLVDRSLVIQASASKWINENFQIGPEVWFVDGRAGSQLGDIRQASRLMFVLKGAFRG